MFEQHLSLVDRSRFIRRVKYTTRCTQRTNTTCCVPPTNQIHFNDQHEINILLPALCIFKFRFKDGKIILGDIIDDNGGSDLTMTNLRLADAGQYACRAVSDGGKILSKLAKLVVRGTGDLFQTHYKI